MKIKVIAAILGVSLALGAIGGTAAWAQQNLPDAAQAIISTNALPDANPDSGRGGGGLDHLKKVALEATAKALGMTPEQLRDELQNNKTIADLAKAKGIDLKTIQSAIITAEKAALDQAVKDGKLTQAQTDKAKAMLDQHADKILDRLSQAHKDDTNGKHNGAPHQALRTGLEAAATALGMTQEQLRDELKSGKSVADVAKAKNVDLQTVKNAVITAEKAQLDDAVKNGKLTQAQADKAKAMLDQDADKLLEHMQQKPKPNQQPKHK